MLNSDLPGYVAKLDSFVSTMVTAVNSQHALGVDRDGLAGGPVFTGTTAATLQVAITDPRKLASRRPRPRAAWTTPTPPRWPTSTSARTPTAA